MKKLFYFVFFFVCFLFSINSIAQISTIKIEEKKEVEMIVPYDSLESINNRNYKSHIGQTLYLLEDRKTKEEDGGYVNFYVSPSYSANTYKSVQHKRFPSSKASDYEYMKGRYFFIDDIIIEPKRPTQQSDEGFLKLIDKGSSDTLYYRFYGSLSFTCFMTVGYFEKLKTTYIGIDFVYVDNRSKLYPEKEGIRNLDDGIERTEIPKGTIFTCMDIVVSDNQYSPILAIINNDDFGKSFVWIDDITRTNISFNKFTPKTEYDKVLVDEENRKNDLTRKYGQSNAKLILEGKVRIGFSQQMCLESWGNPIDINKTTGSYGVHEQWVYSGENYLYFENGKLTTIQN